MSWFHRIRNAFSSRRLEQEIDEELRFHIEARTQDNMRGGMSEPEARADAQRRFGSRPAAREGARDSNVALLLDTTLQDLRYAIRGLRRRPGFAAVAILTLALGIGANTAVFTLVNGVLLRPLPFPDSDRLYWLSYAPPLFGGRAAGMIDRHYIELSKQASLFASMACYRAGAVTLTGAGDPVRLPVAEVTGDFFRVLGVNAALGRTLTSAEVRTGAGDVALLSDSLWRGRIAADPGILGRTIRIDGSPRTVIGILPAGFAFPERTEVWLPLDIKLDPGNSLIFPVIARPKAGVRHEQAQESFRSFTQGLGLFPFDQNGRPEALMLPLKQVLVGDVRTPFLIFSAAVTLVLLIACVNFANLLLMRGAARRQEITVREALGAGQLRLVRQLTTESMLLSLAGGTAGVLFARWGARILLRIVPEGVIPRVGEVGVDGWVLVFALCLSLGTGLVFGLAPAVHATRSELRDSLSAGPRAIAGRRARLRIVLVIAEFALALVLLAGAGLMIKSFVRLRSVDLGFRPEGVYTMTVDLPEAEYRTPAEMRIFQDRLLARLRRLTGVSAASSVNTIPLGEFWFRGDFRLDDGRAFPKDFLVSKLSVGPGYFRAMGIRLLAGRDFDTSDDARSPGVVILSRSVARRLWPGADPIGKRLSMENHPNPGDWLTVIGVVDDIRQMGYYRQREPASYQPYMQVARPLFLRHASFVVRSSGHPASLPAAMRAALREVDPNLPAQSIATMHEVIARTTVEPEFQTRLMTVFSLLAVLLAAVGIYGVLACSVAERTHEIGIRMALGAGSADVLRIVLRRTLLLSGAGVGLGLIGALALTKWIENLLFEVQPSDPAVMLAVAALMLVVGATAAVIPARRAAKVAPVTALRYE